MKASFPKEGLQAFMASNFFSYLLTAFPGLLHPVCSVIYLRYLKSSRKNFKIARRPRAYRVKVSYRAVANRGGN
jgi:hypothetical protein